jgi:hypothetical protein
VIVLSLVYLGTRRVNLPISNLRKSHGYMKSVHGIRRALNFSEFMQNVEIKKNCFIIWIPKGLEI